MVGVRYGEAGQIWRRSGNGHRREIRSFDGKSEWATDRDPWPSEYRRKRSVLALLSEARACLLDRGVGLGDVLPLRTNPYCSGSKLLRGYRHREYDGRRVEREQLPLIAVYADFALSSCRPLCGEEHRSNEQNS